MDEEPTPAPPENPLLRYLATLRAARDFGVSRAELERVVRRSNPLTTPPEELAATLADVLIRDGYSL